MPFLEFKMYSSLLVEITIILLRILSPISIKINFFISEHNKSLEKIKEFNIKEDKKRLWFHCASLGEFEQSKPLIQKIKSKYPKSKIIISFFSPSGYQIGKNYKFADFVCYLPFDSKKNVNSLLEYEILIFLDWHICLIISHFSTS